LQIFKIQEVMHRLGKAQLKKNMENFVYLNLTLENLIQ